MNDYVTRRRVQKNYEYFKQQTKHDEITRI